MHLFWVASALLLEGLGIGFTAWSIHAENKANPMPAVWEVAWSRIKIAFIRNKPEPALASGSANIQVGTATATATGIAPLVNPSVEQRVALLEEKLSMLKKTVSDHADLRREGDSKLAARISAERAEIEGRLAEKEAKEVAVERKSLDLQVIGILFVASGVICSVLATLTA